MKCYFYGIYGIRLISHGCWSEPELIWHNKSFSYYDVENALWEDYNEECKERNKEGNENDFAIWVKKNAPLVREYLQNLMDNKRFYD